jgi:catechol 2,3-dioxygenase-like lactoylglutathione lyase family enzyme
VRSVQTTRPVAFVASTDLERSRAFYVDRLGLEPVGQDEYALDVRSGAVPVRITHVPDHVALPFTVLGWEVDDLAREVAALRAQGVATTRYPWFDQDDDGVWVAPGGTRVAWFADPDGNVLSLSQAVTT